MRAYQVNFDGQVAVKTGGSSGDLLFTSAGDDGLMEEFKSYNARVSVDQQMKNNSLAKAITNAKLSRSSGEIAVSITVDEFGNLKTYRLTASSEDSKMKLSLSRNGTTGEMPFEGGFLKCLDIDGGCQTAYAKIKFAGGYARIIFRNSAADLHFLLQEKITGNSAFSALAKYILNAVNSVATSEKIEGMNVSSFEIINGRSAMGALMTTEDRQMIGLNIPMVVSSNATDVNANVTKSTDLSKSFDLDNLAGSYGTGLSQNISAVKLVKNNGRGQFKLQLQMGNAASIWIVIARMQKETISLEEIRTFESTVRAF